MLRTARRTILLLLLASLAALTAGCLSINKQPDTEPTKDVNVGGSHGVTVER